MNGCARSGADDLIVALGFEKRRELPIRDEAVNYFLGIPGTDGPELELR